MSYEDKTTTTLDGRKATPEAQLELRRRCIVYFRDGVKRAEIARRLGLSRQWVTKIIKIYQTEGFDRRASEILCPWDNRSPPNGCIQ